MIDLDFALEIINGAWAILSLELLLVCAVYLSHEIRTRGFSRKKWTSGMRVAVSIATVSLGVCTTRTMIFVWRHVYGGESFSNSQIIVVIIGAIIGAIGLICSIRELSLPLYGRMPWIIAMIFSTMFVLTEIV